MSKVVNCSNCSIPDCKVRGTTVAATDCPEIKRELNLKKLDYVFKDLNTDLFTAFGI